MQDVRLSVGRRVFTFKCDSKDIEKINFLSRELNTLVNRNVLKYRGLSEDNVFLLTVFELLDSIKSGSFATQGELIEERQEPKKEVIIIKHEVAQPPELHHPYQQNYQNIGEKWSTDLFGYDLNTDLKAVESLLEKQDEIDKEIASISAYLNSIIIGLANAENNNM